MTGLPPWAVEIFVVAVVVVVAALAVCAVLQAP